MKVEFSTTSLNSLLTKGRRKNELTEESNPITGNIQEYKLAGSQIPFGAIYGIKTGKMDILTEKFKLLKKVEDMINEKNSYTQEALYPKVLRARRSKLEAIVKRKLRSMDLDQQNFSYESFIYETKDDWLNFAVKVADETNEIIAKYNENDTKDYKLLSRFQAAIIKDNMNLADVFKDYYSKLSELTTIKEVKKQFPRLEIPQNPTNIISQKIVRLLTKDFYTTYDQLRTAGKTKEANAFCQETIKKIIRELAELSKADANLLERKLLKPTMKAAIANYNKTRNKIGLATIPEIKKLKNNSKLTPADIQMISVDYNQFALYTLRQQYIEGKAIDEIVYREGDIIIPLKSLRGTDYKIAKPDEKIRTFIKQAEQIKAAERNYERFTDEQLQKRLNHFGDMETASNPEILERLVEFDSAQFAEGDRAPLIKFLRVLDDITDKKITLEEGTKIIQTENLRPHGTINLDRQEKEQRIKDLKQAQKINAEFDNYCQRFDNVIDMLYKSNMEEVATQCTLYRPKALQDSREISNKIIQLINSGLQNGEFVNPKRTEAELKNLSKYFQTKLYDENSPFLKAAEEFGRKTDGTINEVEAGQYLSSAETISQYPGSKGLYRENEQGIIDSICKEAGKNTDTAIRNLIKYNNFTILPEKEQSKISKFLETFDINVPTEKDIIEAFVNNIYINSPTYIETILNKAGTSTKESIMMPSAKQSIIDDKLFPHCIDYFEVFEKYMTRVAQSKNDFGIQVIGTNNKQLRKQYKFEVKVPMEERLYSKEGDFKFEVYKSGLHKAKNTKA